MSYITNSKALRLGFTARWDYQHVAPNFKDYHLNFKIRAYILGLLKEISRHGLLSDKLAKDSLIKQRIDYHNSMKKQLNFYGLMFLQDFKDFGYRESPRGFIEKRVSNFIPGQVLIQRRENYMFIKVFCYFDLLNATIYWEKRLKFFWAKLVYQLTRWLQYPPKIYVYNSFYFFWTFNVLFNFPYFRVIKSVKRKVNQISKALGYFWDLQKKRLYHLNAYFRTYFKRFRSKFGRHRYFQSTASAILMLFAFPFDAQLLATIIAYELGRLRQYHKIYLKFLRRTLHFGFHKLGKFTLRGLSLSIRGGLTLFRRRMTRTSMLRLSFGKYTRNLLSVSAVFGKEVSRNRFCSIGVSVHGLLKPRANWNRGTFAKLAGENNPNNPDKLENPLMAVLGSGMVNSETISLNAAYKTLITQKSSLDKFEFQVLWDTCLFREKRGSKSFNSLKKPFFFLHQKKFIADYYPATFSTKIFKTPFRWLV